MFVAKMKEWYLEINSQVQKVESKSTLKPLK